MNAEADQPPLVQPRKRGHLAALIIGALGILIVAGVLFFFNPTQYGFYPVCLFYKTTGLLCPGCGGLRAMHQLLHGNFAAAFRLNALLVILLIPASWLGLREVIKQLTGRKLPALFLRPIWGWLLFGSFLAFSILRNIRW